jgi:hypothetical protein
MLTHMSPNKNTRQRPFITPCVVAALLTSTMMFTSSVHAAPPDHTYAQWNSLVQKHVKWLPGKKASQVDYAQFAKDRESLKGVLKEWSAVTQEEYNAFSREQKMAFLINAYNGYTVELILTKYPKLKSIKDLGSFLKSPWKNEFFTLLGKPRHLDWIEHEQLRPVFKDSRVHAAVNCASVGCPALLDEAFTAAKLNSQLETGFKRFLSDKTRNRVQKDELQVSSIFKWFKEDFEGGSGGFQNVKDVFAKYAKELSDDPAVQQQLVSKSLEVTYLDYDWSLNDIPR